MSKTKSVIIIILIISNITILLKEKYHLKIANKFKSKYSNKSFHNNNDYQRELDLYRTYQKKGDIVMLGNSISYQVNWNELLNRTDVINRGIGKDITEGFKSRLKFVKNVNPKICFIMGGINDLFNDVSPNVITENLNDIAISLNNDNIKPIIFSIIYLSETHPNCEDLNTLIKVTNENIKSMCLKSKIDYIDLNNSLSPNNKLKKEYSNDGIHLTGLGYTKWKEIILPIIEQEME